MGTFEIRRIIPAATTAVWQVITDWPRYAEWMPLTRMEQDDGDPTVGWTFTGLTGVGPVHLRDSMMLTAWQPPQNGGAGQFRLTKTGRQVAGWAAVSVTPHASGTLLTWRESVALRPPLLGRVLAPIADPVVRRAFARVVDAMARAAAAR